MSTEKNDSNQNALALLADNFAKMDRLEINLTEAKFGIEMNLFCPPLSFEESAGFSRFIDESGGFVTGKICKFLCDKLELENGEKAFKNCNNEPAAKVLKDRVQSKIVLHLVTEISQWAKADSDEAEEVEGK